jgi:hypothetical protein
VTVVIMLVASGTGAIYAGLVADDRLTRPLSAKVCPAVIPTWLNAASPHPDLAPVVARGVARVPLTDGRSWL